MKHPAWLIGGMFVALWLAPLNGWAQADAITSSGTYTMTHDGIPRIFRVHLPRGYSESNPAMPLVLAFHGWGGNEDAFLGFKSVRKEADRRGFILVAPRGLGSGDPDNERNSWTFSGSDTGKDGDGENPDIPGDTDAICGPGTPDYRYPSCEIKYQGDESNTCSWTQCQSDDIDFTLALVAYVSDRLNVDLGRVYAMGGSNGGMFAWELGQDTYSAPYFRAVAPLIGLPHRGYLNPPGKEGGDLPVLVITGTRDSVVPPGDWEDDSFTTTSNGSDRYYYTGATAITRIWAEAHGCYDPDLDPGEEATQFDDGNRKTDCRTYCDVSGNEWPKVLDCRARMGHSYSLSWSWNLILEFFDNHR